MKTHTKQSIYKKKNYLLLDKILKHDGYTITHGCAGVTCCNLFSTRHRIQDAIDFTAYNSDDRIIFFLFYNKKRENIFKQMAARIYDADKDFFKISCYLIFMSSEEMNRFRFVEWAENWQRGFFISLDELEKKAAQIDKTGYGKHTAELHKKKDAFRSKQSIKHFTAEIISNTPVGNKNNPEHYLLKFKAADLNRIVPGQFVMVDTSPDQNKETSDYNLNYSFNNLIKKSFKRKSFLKRPFGIHRAYYKYFKLNYLKHLFLPPGLASISHTVFPHEFEILYKILDDGTGTNELKKIKPGNTLKMLGPLGNYENPALWRLNGIEEIHLIGGGVGMAPLVFFGQALKFYAYNIKAFIGINTIETLIKSAPLARTFVDKPENAFIYIDELSKIGLLANEIFLASELEPDNNLSMNEICAKNIYHGFVTEQYHKYLSGLQSHKKIMIIACGPAPMLKALKKIVNQFRIPMKVLLEKRMGCGIGVCMSCVCRTIKNNKEEYSRVCMEGPMFDAEKICWEKL